MKRFLISLSAIATLAAVPTFSSAPVLAELQQTGEAIAQRLRRPEVKLKLSAQKKLVKLDKNGQKKVSWKAVKDGAVVQPGDVLRYTLSGRNIGDAAAANLVLKQPIPAQMRYVLNSATNNAGMTVMYSIDNGKNFVKKPMVKVKQADGKIVEQPAPPELYTHVQWSAANQLPAQSDLKAFYEVKVR